MVASTLVSRSFLGGEFAGGESSWWRGNWIPTKAFFFVIMRPYFRGDATTIYCVNVKAKTMDADIETGNAGK